MTASVVRRRRSATSPGLRAITVALTVLVLTTVNGGTPDAQIAPTPGRAHASAQVLRVKQFYAGLTIPVPIGLSISSYQDARARALGAAIDLSAVIGLVDVPVDTPGPVTVDSSDGDDQHSGDLGAGPLLGRVALSATGGPSSRSDVRLIDLDLPGLLQVRGGRSSTEAAFNAGGERTAVAVVEIDEVVLAGGLVELRGLRWEARHRSGVEADGADASFEVAAVLLAGVPLPLSVETLQGALGTINGALAPTGLVLAPPAAAHLPDGSVDIGALRIGMVSSPLGAEVLGPIVGDVRPGLLPVFEALSDAESSLGVAALVLDLGLGVVDGSGGVELAIGGANAGSGETPAVEVDLPTPAPGVAPAAGSPSAAAPRLPVIAAPPAPGAPEMSAVPGTPLGDARCALAAHPQRRGGCRDRDLPAALGLSAAAGALVGWREVAAKRRGRAQGAT